jgi:hypothetical protein
MEQYIAPPLASLDSPAAISAVPLGIALAT